MNMYAQEERPHHRSAWRGMLLGQLISLVMTFMAVLSKVLVENYQFSTPALQNALGYFVTFAFAVIPYSLMQKTLMGRNDGMLLRLLVLFFIALADSQASFFGNLAFRYRVSVSSAGMLSSFTIPCVMLLSFVFLGSSYRKRQLFGVIFAIFGIGCVFMSDSAIEHAAIAAGTTTAKASIYGDALILLSSAVYAVGNVISEGYVKTQDVYEYLLWVGLIGFVISATQFFMLEIPLRQMELREISRVEAAFAGYAILFAMFYFLVARFLSIYDSVALNLSLMTTGFWGMVLGEIMFHEQLVALKVLGYAVVVLGLGLYYSEMHANIQAETSPVLRGRRVSNLGKGYGTLHSNT